MASVDVYTDGSVLNNGKNGSSGGIGVYFGHGHPLNTSQRIKGTTTNNRAELLAIIKALILISDHFPNRKVNLRTDSLLSINVVEKKWKAKMNLDLVSIAQDLLADLPLVSLHHVRSHTGLSDPHSLGNHEADRLANQI